MTQNPILLVGLLLAGLIIGYFLRQYIAIKGRGGIEQKIKKQLDEAKAKSAELILEAQEKSVALIGESKKEERGRKTQLDRLEERLLNKEETLEKELQGIRAKENKLNDSLENIKNKEGELEGLQKQATEQIQKVANLSPEEAKDIIIQKARESYQKELSQSIQKLEKERRDEIEKRSLDIITTAIQRYSRSHVSEITTTIFPLGSEDLKGKIIGREGRNIKALERLTGVEFIIDEAPDYVVISSFDPMRREVARLSLEKLVKDGRIQPARIEEKVEEAKQEINKRIIEIGEESAFEVGIYDLPKEIIQLLGRLHFRTSYGQNVLVHSIEAAHIASMIASELGVNVDIAKKASLLHDIGKAIDHEVAGNHVELGQKILRKYGVSEDIVHAMEAHHEDYPFSTPESFIVAAADALSAARPGARRENLENYVKRLQELEKIAVGFEGVKNAYAISAGRELRIFVIPEKIDDFGAFQLAKNVASKIESELKYPGEIKVNVIREIKAVEYAK
ncbi:ribonuclease Y [Candidatus Wolfebacteria bacterium CG10_big_fil_rev_8_21_14_0_10_31_9]|uniref:Ribonuclease Y n=1 Tax=Candidatus Wolfebacteria bacterium CG10_big_fil_rev_8_21_14_0_10_31_9 TaxID=1975070 RepID=A0A2H0RCJ8_9BACT|nr:MAG: ribonuclease Y [Candidatus Wolfebacteria bacterium CG10_big_fil_rev_8_21_14_0_10_31_9]